MGVLYKFCFNFLIFVCFTIAFDQIPNLELNGEKKGRCEEITIDYCKGVAYNETILPNIRNHYSQIEAAEELEQYKHLMTFGCHPSLNIFLCTIFVPVCTNIRKLIPPCRPLCFEVQADCEPFMKKFEYSWPSIFKCDQFPITGLCVGENSTKMSKDLNKKKEYQYNSSINKERNLKKIIFSMIFDEFSHKLLCPSISTLPNSFHYKLKISNKILPNCGLPCNPFFTSSQKYTSSIVLGVASIIGLLTSLITVFSFFINKDAFKQPEKCVLAMVICYGIVCFGYITGLIFGDNLACVNKFENNSFSQLLNEKIDNKWLSKEFEVSSHGMHKNAKVEIQGTHKEFCTFIFVIIYYFNMAAYIWWLLLCLSWMASTGVFEEKIKIHFLHLLAWSLPALKTILVLTWNAVEGDSFVGICYVGLSNIMAQKLFVLVPLITYFLCGHILLAITFIRLYKIRRRFKKEALCLVHLEKIIIKISVFVIIYCILFITVIACHVYEVLKRSSWMMAWYLKNYPALSSSTHASFYHQVGLLMKGIGSSHSNQEYSGLLNNFTNSPYPQKDIKNFLPSHSIVPSIGFNVIFLKHFITIMPTVFISLWIFFFMTWGTIMKKVMKSYEKDICCKSRNFQEVARPDIMYSSTTAESVKNIVTEGVL